MKKLRLESKDAPLLKALYRFVPSLRGASDRALSVYMPARREGFDLRHYDIEIGQLRRRYMDRLDDEAREIMERELMRLRDHLVIVKPAGCPSIAGFSDEPVGLLELVNLPQEVEARLEVGPLLLAPIERLIEKSPPALVVVVDKEEGKLLAAVLDEVYPIAHIKGVEVKHSKAGGTSAQSNQRKADNRTKANMERVLQAVEREVKTGEFGRLFVGGTQEARAELERLMPPAVKKLLAGHVPASLQSTRLQHDLREQLILTRTS
jgi:release factor family 10